MSIQKSLFLLFFQIRILFINASFKNKCSLTTFFVSVVKNF
ncbi:hypothetical protein FEM21_01040 [Flavobacterium seoulense]|uniref:Uncharacterized protein n=1 Tax=Flavobacterium seoulense TaxID=1492738 RepID=A0A066WS05_9FLAO|nr:hypothetical protein FEM21_01040 [Flavobacterium seoulense]